MLPINTLIYKDKESLLNLRNLNLFCPNVCQRLSTIALPAENNLLMHLDVIQLILAIKGSEQQKQFLELPWQSKIANPKLP